jgi:ribosome-binding protein aMBF1 (putative translation factor)
MNQNIQDWEPVTIRSKNPSVGTAQKTSVPRKSTEAIRLAKLDNTDEIKKAKTLTSESRKELVTARLALKKSQAEMDAQCALPKNTFREIEAGRLTPTGGMLNRVNRELKVSLRLE